MLRRFVPLPVRLLARQWPRMLELLAMPAAARGLAADFPHLQAARTTPLRRPTAHYGEALQRAKETNVELAAHALDGVVIGESFSWHRTLGPPLKLRGVADGPQL